MAESAGKGQRAASPLGSEVDSPGTPVWELAIETSTRGASLALACGERGWSRSLEPGAAHASDLLPLLQVLLQEAGQDRQALQRVYVGIGPGSFTGLRVGAAVALGLARALDVQLVAVPSVEAVAWAHLQVGETGTVVLDARSGALYAASYTRAEERLVEQLAPTRMPLEQAPRLDWPQGVLLGDARAAEWLGVSEQEAYRWRAEAEPNAQDLLALGRLRWQQRGPSDPSEIRPLYLAPFGA